jgi:FMN hydrolase / 5-amino-6-(5-phospho-D-ribitylamino)uracil phosphatase
MTPPRAILWDLMDTLVRDPFFFAMAPFFGLSFEELLAQKHPKTWLEFELGRIGEEELYARFFRDGRSFDGQAFKRHVRAAYAWVPGMEDMVCELRERGANMHLLSNYPEWHRLCDEQLGVHRYVEPSFVSCKTGFRKPSDDAYLHACRTLGLEPEQCLFIDDREPNCAAARALGMPAVRFEGDAGALREELVRRGWL